MDVTSVDRENVMYTATSLQRSSLERSFGYNANRTLDPVFFKGLKTLLALSVTSAVVVTRLAASAAQWPQHQCACGKQWLIFLARVHRLKCKCGPLAQLLLVHSAQCRLKLSNKPILLAETIRPPHAVSLHSEGAFHYNARFVITLISLGSQNERLRGCSVICNLAKCYRISLSVSQFLNISKFPHTQYWML